MTSGVARLHVSGDGRMGSSLVRLVREGDPAATGLIVAGSLDEADVVIDYSHPEWTAPLVEALLDKPRPLLVGTTGLSDALHAALGRLAEKAPVLIAANTGTGIQVLKELVEQAAKALGGAGGWDIEVLEMHHHKKVDAPSGTAWLLVDAAARGSTESDARRDDAGSSQYSSQAGRDRAVAARVGEVGARTENEIGVQSLRGGDVVGEHTVYLVGHGERIELTHRCWDRDTFVRGGLRGARWLAEPGRAPGLYSMQDVLGLGGA